jgi:hypothetical protein
MLAAMHCLLIAILQCPGAGVVSIMHAALARPSASPE